MTSSIIPEVVWAAQAEELVHQYTMCLLCGPHKVPTKIFHINGTTFCPDHAQEEYARWVQSRQ